MMQSNLAVLRINFMGSMMVLKLKPLNFLLALELQVLGVGTIFGMRPGRLAQQA
jgi:hypothetical protein